MNNEELKQQLIELLRETFDYTKGVCIEFNEAVEINANHLIANGVTIRERGDWVHLGGDEWCCSACEDVIHTEGSWEKPTQKFCEECGADMRGEKDECL